jgi:hypothetical protein
MVMRNFARPFRLVNLPCGLTEFQVEFGERISISFLSGASTVMDDGRGALL